MPPVNLLIGQPGRKNANADVLSRAPFDMLSEDGSYEISSDCSDES